MKSDTLKEKKEAIIDYLEGVDRLVTKGTIREEIDIGIHSSQIDEVMAELKEEKTIVEVPTSAKGTYVFLTDRLLDFIRDALEEQGIEEE